MDEQVQDSVPSPRPFDTSGEFTTIAPECFTDGNVISLKGENYYRACDQLVMSNPDGSASYCVLRVDHPGMYCEDYEGNKTLRFDSGEKPSRNEITVIWPRTVPDGAPITKAGLKAAWNEILKPMQEGAALTGEMSDELRTLMAAFRHIYGAMPDDEV